jgi:hypothetical protein
MELHALFTDLLAHRAVNWPLEKYDPSGFGHVKWYDPFGESPVASSLGPGGDTLEIDRKNLCIKKE